jgi:hypothetical protein
MSLVRRYNVRMFGRTEERRLIFHVSQNDGRTIEELLAPRSPLDTPTAVGGAIVDATYVARDPALLARFAGAHVPWATDPMSSRFASPGYLGVASIAALPYAPATPLSLTARSRDLDRMIRRALEFQAAYEPAMYMVPSLPLPRVSARALSVLQHSHEVAAQLNGSVGIPYRPMLATVFPGLSVMRGRYSVFERLSDRAFSGVYVQALQLNAKRDSLEKLVTYTEFLLHARETGFRVVAGRPGTFGLVLGAFGIDAFDSALGDGESYSLSRLVKPRLSDPNKPRKGGRQRRIYFSKLLTVLGEDDAAAVLGNHAVRAQLACGIEECAYDVANPLRNPRRHFFHSRVGELEELERLQSEQLRIQYVRQRLDEARDAGRLVNRVWRAMGRDEIDFSHLDRWLAVTNRVAAVVAVRSGE